MYNFFIFKFMSVACSSLLKMTFIMIKESNALYISKEQTLNLLTYVNDGPIVHTITLSELTMEHLKQEIVQITQPIHTNEVLVTIFDENGGPIRTDKNVIQAFKRNTVYFTVQFQSKSTQTIPQRIENIPNLNEIVVKKGFEEQVASSPPRCEVKYPLVLLAGAIKYERQPYLEGVKYDLHLLQTLFQTKFGYEVFSTYNPQNLDTEQLTLNELNSFIVRHCSNLTDGTNNHASNNTDYDGLIFVWCGNGEFGESGDALITSDNKAKDFKEIQSAFATKTEYFIGRPKIFIKITYKGQEECRTSKVSATAQKKIWYDHDTDMFTIYVNTSDKTIIESSKDSFIEIFYQVMEKNMNKSLEFITKQVINIVLFDQILEREMVQAVSIIYSDIYLIPRLSEQSIQSGDSGEDTKYEQSIIEDGNVPETLDFKKHWNRNWRKSNTEAAKIVEIMLHDNEQGLIVIAYNTLKWKTRNDNLSSIAALVNNDKDDIKEFGEYIMYVVKRKLIMLEEINIDGNIYAVDCEIHCKGHVNITTQIFATKHAMIDQQLKQSFPFIRWNTKIHRDIAVQLQDLEYKEEECTNKRLFDESILHFQNYLQIVIDNFGVNHPYIVVAYNTIGLRHRDKGQYDKAIELFEKALQIISDIFGINYKFVAQLHGNLGNVYNKKEKYEEAIACFEKSLKIKLELFGTCHVDVAAAYESLGCIYQNKNQYDKAIECYEKTLQIRLDIFDMNSNDVVNSYTNLARTYQSKQEHERAIEYYEKSLKISLEIFGEKHSNVVDSYHGLGFSYDAMNQYDKALECYEKALHISLDIFGTNHETVADLYNNLGCVCQEKSQYDKTIEYQEKALHIRLTIFGNNHVDVAQSYDNLGISYEKLDKYDQAIDVYDKALKIRQSLFGTYHIDVFDSYTYLGFAYIRAGKYDKAIVCHETALEIKEKITSVVDEDVYDLYELLGLSYEAKGDTKIACKYYEGAWKGYSRLHGEWNETAVRAKEEVAELNKKLVENERIL
ncbi:hypothetical protein RFI_00901 [Reticulomyxa filosa]|uniref:Uncharacterized protein n=1 Tax=Reticulomyxa filosa TaxID=46433 RepID=X6PCB1_RETFI|nr:hypothetical protein RFI_00901 [Reticulomyxa filosa]|eukprot:ETO36160.1 hypothetical protein RFI_00901 [Reticulomyxa filosa]